MVVVMKWQLWLVENDFLCPLGVGLPQLTQNDWPPGRTVEMHPIQDMLLKDSHNFFHRGGWRGR